MEYSVWPSVNTLTLPSHIANHGSDAVAISLDSTGTGKRETQASRLFMFGEGGGGRDNEPAI